MPLPARSSVFSLSVRLFEAWRLGGRDLLRARLAVARPSQQPWQCSWLAGASIPLVSAHGCGFLCARRPEGTPAVLPRQQSLPVRRCAGLLGLLGALHAHARLHCSHLSHVLLGLPAHEAHRDNLCWLIPSAGCGHEHATSNGCSLAVTFSPPTPSGIWMRTMTATEMVCVVWWRLV